MEAISKMNPEADSILSTAGLPRLRIFPLGCSVSTTELPKVVYLRAPSPATSPGMMTRDELTDLSRKRSLSGYIAVEFLSSLAGAVCVDGEGFTLIELVHGHLSGLLQHGMLAARYLVEHGSGRVLRHAAFSQSAYVDSDSLDFRGTAPVHGQVNDSDLLDVAVELAQYVRSAKMPARMLTEVMITPRGPVWVDAKSYPWQVDVHGLFSPERTLIYGKPTDTASFTPSDWTTSSIPEDVTRLSYSLDAHALTCHFITYSLGRGLGALYNHSNITEGYSQV